MPKQIKLRRGTTAQHATFTGAEGEVTMDTSKKTLVVHDGLAAGGFPMLSPTSSLVNCGNLLMVDAVNGNNATAQRGKMQWPFLTLTAAKAAAVAGDTVVVFPGTYNDTNLAKNGVNWHFMPGAIVDFVDATLALLTAIFDTSIPYGAGTACTFSVTGHGVFRLTHCSAPLLTSAWPADSILIECDSIETPVTAIGSRGYLRLACPSIAAGGPAIVLGLQANSWLQLSTVATTDDGAAIVNGGDFTSIFADSITGATGGIQSSAGPCYVAAREIKTAEGVAVATLNGTAGLCSIRGARLVTGDSSAGVAATVAGSKLTLIGCHLYGSDVGGVSLYAPAAANVYLYGESTANFAKHANVTLVGSALTVDAGLV